MQAWPVIWIIAAGSTPGAHLGYDLRVIVYRIPERSCLAGCVLLALGVSPLLTPEPVPGRGGYEAARIPKKRARVKDFLSPVPRSGGENDPLLPARIE